METITSRENAKIKYACRLREEEKLRTADGLFFAEGPKLCLELARGCTLQTLYATEKALAHTPELEAFAGKTVLVTCLLYTSRMPCTMPPAGRYRKVCSL